MRPLLRVLLSICLSFLFVSTASAAVRTWDGGGGDNNWSTCANWAADTCPGTGDSVTFDSTSTKDSTIDAGAPASVAGFTIAATYSGTITQSRDFASTSGLTQNAGTYTVSAAYTLSVSGAALDIVGGIFNQGTGTITVGNSNCNTSQFKVTGGTFNGNSSASLDINHTCGGFVVSSGTFVAPGTIYISDDFSFTGGAFTHNSGTVIVDGANAPIFVGSPTFNNLTISVGHNIVVQLGDGSDTFTVVGAFTVNDGKLNGGASGNILGLQGTASFATNYDGAGSTPSAVVITLNGAGTQNISLIASTYPRISITNASATINGPSTGSVTISKGDQSAGIWNLGNADTTFTEGLYISGGTMTQGSGMLTVSNASCSTDRDFSITGGTFTGGSGAIDWNGNCGGHEFILSGSGAFTSTSSTFNIGAAVTITGGTFTHNGGTVILDGAAAAFDVNTTITLSSFTVSKNTGVAATIGTGDTVVVVGTLTLTDGIVNTGTLDAQGSVTVGSGFDSGSTLLKFSGSATQTFTLTGAEALFNGDINVNKSGGAVNLASGLTMNANSQDLIIQEGTFDLSGFALSVTAAATETIIIETGGNLQLQGGETITGDSASYPQLDSGSTVTYDGTVGPYTLKDYTYKNLTINGAGAVFNPAANEVLGGNLTVTAGTLDVNDLTLAINGNTVINGGTMKSGTNTITFGDAGADSVTISSGGLEIESDVPGNDIVKNATTWTNSGGTITYNAATGIVGVVLSGLAPYFNLAINSSGSTYSLQAITDVDGNLTITAGTLDAGNGGNFNMTVGGNWANTGTFTARGGTVGLDSASASAISGSTTFNNLTCTTAGKALTFTAASTQTISGLLTLTGASGNLITLRSSSDNTAWNLTVNGTSSVDYVNVRDSNAGGGNAITHAVSPSRSVNVANNTNWGFNAAPTVASVTGVQASTGTANVTITFIMDDPDDDNTLQAKVEYSLDGGGSWNDPTLSTTNADTSATQGDPSINNSVTYQVGQSGAYILSSGGANTVTTVWVGATDLLTTVNIANARIRITPYDGTLEGTAASSSNFILDRVAPSGLANFGHTDFSSSQAVLSWTAATDTNFNHYEIWHGETESQVIARSGSAVEWDNDNDSALTTASTVRTTINNTDPRNKFFKIFAVDNYGNELTVGTYYIGGGSSSSSSSGSSSGGSSSGSSSSSTTDTSTDTTDSGSSSGGSSGESTEEAEEEVTEEVVEEEPEEEEETSGTTWEDFDVQPEEGHWSEGYVKYLEEQTNIVEVAVSQPTFLEILLSILETPNESMPRGNALEFLLVLAGHSLDTMTINVRAIAFEDVSLDDDQAGFIQYAYEQRLIQGYPDGTFQPDRIVNRAEALKLCSYFFEGDWTNPVYGDELLELYELTENPFTDVDLNAWYAPYLINAYAKGVVDGYGDGTFGPGNSVTYAEFLKIATLMQNIEEAVELAEELE